VDYSNEDQLVDFQEFGIASWALLELKFLAVASNADEMFALTARAGKLAIALYSGQNVGDPGYRIEKTRTLIFFMRQRWQAFLARLGLVFRREVGELASW
jgi:hypothetical protein